MNKIRQAMFARQLSIAKLARVMRARHKCGTSLTRLKRILRGEIRTVLEGEFSAIASELELAEKDVRAVIAEEADGTAALRAAGKDAD